MNSSNDTLKNNSYLIGSAHDRFDLASFWLRSLSDADRLNVLSVSHAELIAQYAISTPTTCTHFDLVSVAKIAKIFVSALEFANANVNFDQIEGSDKADRRKHLCILQVMERKLVDLQNERSLGLHLMAVLLYYISDSDMQSRPKLLLLVTILIGSTIVYRFKYLRRFIFRSIAIFNEGLIPRMHIPILLGGPILLRVIERRVNRCTSMYFSFPLIGICCISNFLNETRHLRRLYKMYLISFSVFNIFMIGYVFANGSRIQFIFALCTFFWTLVSWILKFGFLSVCTFGALAVDIVFSVRRSFLGKIISGGIFMLATYHTINAPTSLTYWISAVLSLLSVSVLIPDFFLLPFVWVFYACIEILYVLLTAFQTAVATVIIFSHSFGLGCEWLRYLRQRLQYDART